MTTKSYNCVISHIAVSPSQSQRKIIYDIGSNNGDDIAYYLLKAEVVVAVEANPALCLQIEARYPREIESGRLHLVNAALADTDKQVVDFYIHAKHHVLSTLKPTSGDEKNYVKCQVNAINVPTLIARYGDPYYIKIDVEGYDQKVLTSLQAHSVKPAYISAESHKIGVFAILSEEMNYQSFKLVDGRSVGAVYKKSLFYSPVLDKMVAYSFPHHSAGPFGNDIFGEWMDKSTMLRYLAMHGLGWKDIHASAIDLATLKS
jgi:FkbM family methyltransferase